jgi:hypothetical protein
VIDRKQEQEQEQKSLIEELDRLLETGNFAGYQERCVALMYAADAATQRFQRLCRERDEAMDEDIFRHRLAGLAAQRITDRLWEQVKREVRGG